MAQDFAKLEAVLREELRVWCMKEKERMKKEAQTLKGGIWDRMPEFDSKAAMRSTVVFERVLGIGLDERLVSPGGYSSYEAMADALVKPMIEKAKEAQAVVQ